MTQEQPPSTQEQLELDPQLKLMDVLRRNQMAWIMFWYLLGVFTIILGLLVYAAFFRQTGVEIKILFGVLDGIIGWSIKQLVSYLFPSRSQPANLPPDEQADESLPE